MKKTLIVLSFLIIPYGFTSYIAIYNTFDRLFTLM